MIKNEKKLMEVPTWTALKLSGDRKREKDSFHLLNNANCYCKDITVTLLCS